MARGAIALAGVEQGEGTTRFYLTPWSVYLESGQHRLRASTDKFTLDLSCRPLKPPVAHGIGGYSLRGKTPESASCYYSFTRLETFGTVIIGPERIKVKGTAWMDHEFSTPPLEAELAGWDWFSIQLSNNTELMIYLLRNRQGVYDPSSSGTFVHGSGKTLHLSQKDFRVEILDRWKSPRSGAVYPSRWRIRVFPLALDLTLVPSLPDQELITEETTEITYWEGSVSVSGLRREKAVNGVGYVEMTGYAKPFNLPR
jgi:predicted secreted hydrolase